MRIAIRIAAAGLFCVVCGWPVPAGAGLTQRDFQQIVEDIELDAKAWFEEQTGRPELAAHHRRMMKGLKTVS